VNAVSSPRWLARWTRIAVIAAIPLMGVTLLAVVWSTDRAIHSASDTVIRGEVETLHAAVWSRLMQPGDLPIADRLAESLEDHSGDGLRYVAAFDTDGNVVAEAGQPSIPPAELAQWKLLAPVGTPARIGDRVRAWYGRPRKPGVNRDRPRASDKRPSFSSLVVEIRPQVADDLASTGGRLLVTGALAALTLSVLAAIMVRWSLGRERAVRTMEQARHLATLGQMSAVLAHEIRNPLASLKGNAQLLAASLPAGEKPRAKADRVVDEATRLEMLSNDLLECARTGELRLRDVDPGGLVRDAAASVDAGRIEVDDAGAPRSWPLDADRIRQVLVNLFENALAISDDTVRVGVRREERSLVITVRDHGPGIADADRPHLFEPFFTRRTRGTGLGLAVAKRFVDLHRGTITAENAPGGGAELRIVLPRTEGPWRAS
jgi:two-component system sensor histidine kinase HydH